MGCDCVVDRRAAHLVRRDVGVRRRPRRLSTVCGEGSTAADRSLLGPRQRQRHLQQQQQQQQHSPRSRRHRRTLRSRLLDCRHRTILLIYTLSLLARTQLVRFTVVFSARCNIYISRLCYDVSVRLSLCLSVCL